MIDADGNGFIDFEEFLTLVAIRCQHRYSASELLEVFHVRMLFSLQLYLQSQRFHSSWTPRDVDILTAPYFAKP